MALMWPRRLPPDVLSNPLRSTECAVFERLSVELDQEWYVFYSRPWHGLTPTGEEIDGECDFVLAHARHGMLCLEVKGGAVAWDPLTDLWTSRDRYGVVHRIKDPVAQARTSKHQLLRKLKEVRGFAGRWIRTRHGVVLPDSGRPRGDLGPDRPRNLFCWSEDWAGSVARWVDGRFAAAEEHDDEAGAAGLGVDGTAALRDLLALPVQLRTPLGVAIRADEQQIAYLTQQQFQIARFVEPIPRVLIRGGAGTGKTVLAAHVASLSASQGRRTLLLCYNEPLAAFLTADLAGSPGVTVRSFHALCREVLRLTNSPIPESRDERLFFEELLPDAASTAAERQGAPIFDTIVVDEGQDFRPVWWLLVDALLTRDANARLRVFADTNQQLYGDARLETELQLSPHQLVWNLRNTRSIHAVAYRHYDGIPVTCQGPEGEKPVCVDVDPATGPRGPLSQLLHRLIEDESVDPGDVAVLVPNADWIGRLAPDRILAGVSVRNAVEQKPGSLTLETWRRFKGLESAVVVLLVDASLAASRELAYVAASRARSRLFVLGEPRHTAAVLGAAQG